jgi:hypothetical protein
MRTTRGVLSVEENHTVDPFLIDGEDKPKLASHLVARITQDQKGQFQLFREP